MINLLKKWTEIGMYANIFNKYRFYNIDKYNIKDRGVMSLSSFLKFSLEETCISIDLTG